MNERIKKLTNLVLSGKMYYETTQTEYDREDLFLSPIKMQGKRICEYILNQTPMILEESCMAGYLRFDGSIPGDLFGRSGHPNIRILDDLSYNKPYRNLITFEWQHATGNFLKIINAGISGIFKEIESSKQVHQDDLDAIEFLEVQEEFCKTIIKWAHKCAKYANELSEKTNVPEYKENLLKLSRTLYKIPEFPADNLYEAILCIYFCYPYLPDSIGVIDRFLISFYDNDIKNGIITEEEAKAYLQELYLMLQSRISPENDRFFRGGESHFCVGGYLSDGRDGFTHFSKIVVDALLELPTFIPQISLRWTKKTPTKVLRFMLDCERKDPNKRIAFVNDEPRLKGLMEYSGFSYEEAINYSMIGCNELSLPGGMVLGFDPINVVRSMANIFHKKSDKIIDVKTFDEFYYIYEQELFSDLWEANEIGAGMQRVRERDCNIVSNFLIDGCIARAKSVTQGGLEKCTALGLLIGITTVIDSLTVVKQFVFDEKIVSMKELVDALKNNWSGFEDLHELINKKAKFFGNDDDCSNQLANRFLKSIGKWNSNDNYIGKKLIFGNLIGYNEHNKFFGDKTKATPDGRYNGEIISFGIGQSFGRDRNGLTALLNSIAKCDTEAVLTGPSVTNITIDEKLILDDGNFEKLVLLFENYFKMGGTHFQLTYVSKEELVNAQITPEKYKHLRVRVSGFSDYFNYLNKNLQDEIIVRTETSKT